MATKYLWNAAAGAGTGADFTNAYTTFALAIGGMVAGDTLIVASDHTETDTVARTLTFPGTTALPNVIISVNRGTGIPTQGAFFQTTGASAINVNGTIYIDGVNFKPGDAANAAIMTVAGAVGNIQRWRNCTITLTSNTGSRVGAAGTTGRVTFEKNVTIVGANANAWLRAPAGSHFEWKDSQCWSGTVASTICEGGGEYFFSGCDLSNMVSKTMLTTLVGSVVYGTFVNCQLVASLAIGAFNSRGPFAKIINCANADGKNRTEYHDYSGAATIDRTVFRTGGASDGEDSFSFKLVSTANARREWPCTSQDIAFNVSSTGAKTVTVHIITDNVTLTDQECWLEVDYLGTALSLDTTVIDDAGVLLAVGVAQPASVEAWTSTGLTTPLKQQLAVTFTAAKVGMHRARIKLGKPSTTVYACPKVVVS